MPHPVTDLKERISYLSQPGVQELVKSCINRKADEIALWLRGRCDHPQWVAQQVTCMQKAASKLPSWQQQGCIFLPVPLEQCTSEVAATLKDDISGSTLLDLTCGLGVDTYFFAKRFSQVTSLEQDEGLALLADHNLRLLGTRNVSVLHSLAEDFVTTYKGSGFDVIYADPARREGSGQRRFLLQHCSPDVLALRHRLTQLAGEVWVKVSPLFDLKEGIRLLSPVREVRVIAVDGEVKEVLFYLTREWTSPVRHAAYFFTRGKFFRFASTEGVPASPTRPIPEAKFLLEPDVAVYKAGLEQHYMAQEYPSLVGGFTRAGGYFVADTRPDFFPGAVYQVLETHSYQPDKLRKYLKAEGLTKANFTRKAFDVPLEKVRQALKMQEGGDTFLIFTRDAEGQRWMLRARRV